MELRLRKNQTDFVGLFFALVVIFGVAVFIIILYNAYDTHIKDNFNDAITASTPIDPSANVTKILEDTSSGIGKFNPLFPFLLIGVFGYVMFIALLSRSHPAFFFIGLIILGVALIIAATFSNVFESIIATDNFAESASEFGIMSLILGNLPIVIFLVFIAIAIILYVFPTKSQQGGAY